MIVIKSNSCALRSQKPLCGSILSNSAFEQKVPLTHAAGVGNKLERLQLSHRYRAQSRNGPLSIDEVQLHEDQEMTIIHATAPSVKQLDLNILENCHECLHESHIESHAR